MDPSADHFRTGNSTGNSEWDFDNHYSPFKVLRLLALP